MMERGVESGAASRRRVLLAANDPMDRQVTTRMLETEGHEVTSVEGGQGVLEALESGDFDVVLMDAEMPVLDGLTTVRMQRDIETGTGRTRVRIVLLAARSGPDRGRCLAAGADACVETPLRAEALRTALSESDAPVEGPAVDPTAPPSRTALLRAMHGDVELLRAVAGIWMEQGEGFVGAVRRAVEAGDAAALREAAHSLKGAALSLAAHGVSDPARALELLGASGTVGPTAKTHLEALETAAGRLRAVLEQILAEG